MNNQIKKKESLFNVKLPFLQAKLCDWKKLFFFCSKYSIFITNSVTFFLRNDKLSVSYP